MKKWVLRIFLLIVVVATIVCCMGMDVNCDGEFQGLSCSIDGCGNGCLDGCGECNHSYKIVEETEPTCKAAGYVKYECRKCGHTDTQYKYKLEHVITTTLHRGDCHDGADHGWYEEEKCSNCDYSKKDYYFNGGYALHIYDEGKVTYYGDGSGCGEITYTCLICDDTKTRNYHSEESPQTVKYKQNLADKQCYTILETCELCNKTFTETWHNDFTERVLVEPTQTEYGLAYHKCVQTDSGSSQHCRFNGWEWYSLIPPTSN